MDSQVHLSVIIPMFKVEKYIKKCIDSILNQEPSSIHFELILIDDGSPDMSYNIAKTTTAGMPNVRIIRQSNQRQGYARNVGLRCAKGKYVWFVDADDWISEKSFMTLEFGLRRTYDAIDFGQVDVFNNNYIRRFERKRFHGKVLTGEEVFCLKSYSGVITHTIYNRSFLLENNLFQLEGVYHEDVEYAPRAYYFMRKVLILDNDLYFVRQNPTSVTRSFNPSKSFDLLTACKSLDSFMKKHSVKSKRFHEIISRCLNSSLVNFPQMDKQMRLNYKRKLKENSFLFNHYILSGTAKYILEGFFLKVNLSFFLLIYKYLRTKN